MRTSSPWMLRWMLAFGSALLLNALTAFAEPVAAHYQEGSLHGYLVLRNAEGKVLAEGDLIQVAHGTRIDSRLIFRFRDGSLDEDTCSFTQRGHFRLLRDHHVQRGRSYPQSSDLSIDAVSGTVTSRYQEKGQRKVDTEHLDLSADLANGVILDILKNIPASAKETKLTYIVPTPKARLVGLTITPEGEDTFRVAGVPQKAVHFDIKVELGGLTGLIAPLIGKQPADWNVWISTGPVPTFVRLQGPLFLNGPIWTIEMTSPVWPR